MLWAIHSSVSVSILRRGSMTGRGGVGHERGGTSKAPCRLWLGPQCRKPRAEWPAPQLESQAGRTRMHRCSSGELGIKRGPAHPVAHREWRGKVKDLQLDTARPYGPKGRLHGKDRRQVARKGCLFRAGINPGAGSVRRGGPPLPGRGARRLLRYRRGVWDSSCVAVFAEAPSQNRNLQRETSLTQMSLGVSAVC